MDEFMVTVYPHVDYAFIVSLITTLDGINHEIHIFRTLLDANIQAGLKNCNSGTCLAFMKYSLPLVHFHRIL
ncbi:hypothetical protein RJ639_006003, partial [Escallonia herrerae]